jgi:hypothetical protein
MTTQTAVLATPPGHTITAKLFTLAAPDAVYKTAGSVTYRTNDTSEAVASFTDVEAGDYKLVYFSGSRWVSRGYRTFSGVDLEVATETPVAVELDSATLQKIDNILEDTSETLPGLIGDIEGGGGGGSATLEKQEEILAAIHGAEVLQVASPNVSGNLVLTQGDDYDGVANPRASWTVATDYTTGWTVRLTIRDASDVVVYTNTGSVVSATVVAVTIAAPTGLTMTGCPGQWQGKFDVELTHSTGKKKTIALGVCYINEDQTR